MTRIWGLWWPVFWNLDRERFRDVRVREALWLLRDFDYINRVYFYRFYNHGVSFFQNSAMAHSGPPSARELALLKPWRGQVPDRVFTKPFRQPPNDGYGVNREHIKRAIELFDEAGWHIHDGVLVNKETDQPFTIDFVFVSPFGIRSNMPFMAQLNRFGIATTARAPEVSNWLYRSRTGSFDGNGQNYDPSPMPGLQLRNRFGSASADIDYGQNWPGIKNPVVDSLIESVNRARTAEDVYAATRALDRVLLWNFYFIPARRHPGCGSRSGTGSARSAAKGFRTCRTWTRGGGMRLRRRAWQRASPRSSERLDASCQVVRVVGQHGRPQQRRRRCGRDQVTLAGKRRRHRDRPRSKNLQHFKHLAHTFQLARMTAFAALGTEKEIVVRARASAFAEDSTDTRQCVGGRRRTLCLILIHRSMNLSCGPAAERHTRGRR